MTRSTAQWTVVTLLLGSAAAVSSCAPPAAVRRQAALAAQAPPPLSQYGQLQVFTTSQSTDGRNIRLRGTIRNPYAQPVEGVRLIFRILSSPSPDARELDREQRVVDGHLDAGAAMPLRWDLQTMYAGQSSPSGFTLQAFAAKRGGQSLPAPPGWRE